jgi:predicted protein tyrosine phosphatase
MFEFRIASIQQARGLLADGWPTHCISMVNGQDDVQPRAPTHVFVHQTDLGHPRPRDIQAALEATANMDDTSRLLVHCVMGMSRSPTVAAGILVQHGVPAADAATMIRKLVPDYEYSRHFAEAMDHALEVHGGLARHLRERPAGPMLPATPTYRPPRTSKFAPRGARRI